MDAGQNILTRGLPKTGQVVEYQSGDDGTYEAGWWKGRLNANNRQRYIARTIGGDAVVLDRATGLMWAADGSAAGCNNGLTIAWVDAINYANGLTFAGFSDWRLPNVKELMSIVDNSIWNPCINAVFTNTVDDIYWTGTTVQNAIIYAFFVEFVKGYISGKNKTELHYIRCVRKGV